MASEVLKELILINSAMSRAFRDHYDDAGLTHVEVPQIVGVTGACENVDTLFRVGNRLGCPLFFSQTGQLCLEQALLHFQGVWTSMHSGRDEELEDERHLRQFLLTEEEFDWSMASAGDRPYDEEEMYETMLQRIETAVKAACRGVIRAHGELLEKFGRPTTELAASLDKPFHRISYDNAIDLLAQNGFDDLKWGDDLKTAEEAAVVRIMNAGETQPRPVFIMRYPKEIKFFNMKVSEKDNRVVLSADLVFPVSGEGVGSAVREHDGTKLEQRLLGSTMFRLHQERGGTLNEFRWYLDLVSSGQTRPHAGYGIGNERVLQYLLGVADIRECSVFHHMARQTNDWNMQPVSVSEGLLSFEPSAA